MGILDGYTHDGCTLPVTHLSLTDGHKYHADGSLSRCKDRRLANGRRKLQGIDCDETLSPVVRPATISNVLCIVVSYSWPIHQLDVKNAFLHGYYHRHFICINLLDDIILTASSSAFLHRVIPSVHGEFAMTDLVQQVCLYMHDPRELHLAALKRILRYVCGTIDHGLQLYVSSTILLILMLSGLHVTLYRFSAKAKYGGVVNGVAETA
nr:ribonuclease H-like domain-containing protein [Tanacetum cinerariifolium]